MGRARFVTKTDMDLLELAKAEYVGERLPGWYTTNELAEALGKSNRFACKWVQAKVKRGEAERCTARLPGARNPCPVYRLKGSTPKTTMKTHPSR